MTIIKERDRIEARRGAFDGKRTLRRSLQAAPHGGEAAEKAE